MKKAATKASTKSAVKKVAPKRPASTADARKTAKTAAAKKTTRKAATKKVATKKPATKKAATKKVGAKKTTATKKTAGTKKTAATKKTAVRKAAPVKTAVTKTATARTATGKGTTAHRPATEMARKKAPSGATLPASASSSQTTTSQRKTKAGEGGTGKPRKITPEQALANTRELLNAKREQDRQPQPWQTLDTEHSHVAEAGYQSQSAMEQAEELHSGESRKAAIQGSISTQDRHQQGKRDNR
ncbi:MAG: hypothetical protein ACREPE_06955 [Lysobacter sp.]